jgi:hypothetical protein
VDSRLTRKLVEDTAKAIAQFAPGTIITHIQMSAFIDVPYNIGNKKQDQKYYNLVGKVWRALRDDYGLFLVNEPKVGYRISLFGEEVEVCDGKFRKGVKKMWGAVQDMSKIRIDRIEDPSKRTKTISISQHRANLAGMTRAGLAAKESSSGGVLTE